MAAPGNRAQGPAQPPTFGPRSRSGCKTCRRRHRKCDERKPTCTPCESRGLECDYQVILKWASVGSINSFDARRRQRTTARRSQAAPRRRESAPTSTASRRDQPASPPTPWPHPASDGASVPEYQVPSRDISSGTSLAELNRFPATERQIHPCYPPFCDISSPGLSTPPAIAQSPRWRHATHAGLEIASYQEQGPGNSRDDDALQQPEELVDDDETSYSCYERPNHYQDAPCSPKCSQWVIDNTFSSFLSQVLPDPAEEIVFTYYIKSVSTCTPAYDSDKNPYRKLALLSLSHPVLLHGILSVSTGHMHNYGQSNDSLLSSRQSRALTSLQAALNTLQMTSEGSGHAATRDSDFLSQSAGIFSVLSPREVALAAIMMQTSSVLMTGIGSVEVHMKCALHFIRDLGYMGRPASSIFMRLLVQRFAMVDVVLAHLRFRRPLAPLDFFMYQSNEQLDHMEPAFREMQGCPQRVLCFMARISVLGADLVQGISPPAQVQAEAYCLETNMRVWGHKYHDAMNRAAGDGVSSPPQLGPQANSTTSQLTYLDVVCECFYWTAHLLLMRRVFLDPTNTTRVQLVRRHLFRLMDSLPIGCGPDSSLPFPFYTAAREAVTQEDREWVRRKHTAWMDTYREGSREYMMVSTEKIWEKGMTAYQPVSNSAAPWDTPYENFIREMDHQASYFMF